MKENRRNNERKWKKCEKKIKIKISEGIIKEDERSVKKRR